MTTKRKSSHDPTRTSGPERLRPFWNSVKWWPGLAGAGFAAAIALSLFLGNDTGSDLGPAVAASGLVYLAAAALRRPSTAWPAFFVAVLVIAAPKTGWIDIDATWLLLVLAALLIGYGSATGALRPAGGLPLQSVAMLGFGAIAATALYVDGAIGAYLVAGGLLAHAAWDAYHHRANRVVGRSMAEFCFVLDTLLAVAIVVATTADRWS